MTRTQQQTLFIESEPTQTSLGFRRTGSGPHTSKTMMLSELTIALNNLPLDATKAQYRTSIVLDNALQKQTKATRQETYKRLAELYSFDTSIPLFRYLRYLWQYDVEGRPIIAIISAIARDDILRSSADVLLGIQIGENADKNILSEHIKATISSSYSRSTLNSIVVRCLSSWTQAGYLSGKVNKIRVRPHLTPGVAAMALFVGYLDGYKAESLFHSFWAKLLDADSKHVQRLATEAAKNGWLSLKQAGGIIEVDFPGHLLKHEKELVNEQSRKLTEQLQ